MHVVLVHPAVIPPPGYGGIERGIAWLLKGLHELGHQTTLISRAGSKNPYGQWKEYPLTEGGGGKNPWEPLLPRDADIVHLRGTPAVLPKTLPYLVTIDGNGKPGETFLPNTVFVSRRHAENHGSVHYVYNGVDPGEYTAHSARNGRLVFLAKASWRVKNLKGALQVARAAGVGLDVIGSLSPVQAQLSRFFPEWRGVRYHGEVDDSRKAEILSRARALIFPVRWEEPFGVVILEALASGCAVLGTPYGALPELITPEVGSVSARASELALAARRLAQAPELCAPEVCRQKVVQQFSHVAMAKAYLGYYERVVSEGGFDSKIPATREIPGLSSSSLLDWA